MPHHTKELFEWIGSIAAKHGHISWRRIYDDAKNATLKSKRPEPNLLVKGDRISIPPVEPKEESGATEITHVFEVKWPKDKFQVRLVDADMYLKAFGPIEYRLSICEHTSTGKISTTGQVIELPLGLAEETGEFDLGGYVLELKIGALEPADRVAGLQARITNLGFDPGPIDNLPGPKTERGIKDFQAHYGVPVDGKHSAATMNKAKSVYGC